MVEMLDDVYMEQRISLMDSGEGGKKFDAGKLRMDLLPPFPMMEIARVLSYGAGKYGDRNWEDGIDMGRSIAAALRHIFRWMAGEERDGESGLHNLAHAVVCIIFVIQTLITHPHLDSRSTKCKLTFDPKTQAVVTVNGRHLEDTWKS